jgi:hypothetical protein
MNRKFYFSLLAFALTLSATVAFVVGSGTGTRAASANAALSALPASDFVISIDTQRAINETLPSLFSGNPALMAKMNAKLDEFQKQTGINPRSFESIAIGGRINSSKLRGADRAVVIARGSFNAEQVLENALASAKAKGEKFQKEEQQYEGKRIILISPTRTVKPDVDATADATSATVRSKTGSDKVAVAVIDSNTLAAGDLESVRAAIDASGGGERVDDELVRLATQRPDAIVGFSGRIPQSLTQKASATSGIEKYFASIRQFYGSFSANGTDAESIVAVRTETAEQAAEIGQALTALKTLSAFGLHQSGGNNAAKADSLADILKGLSITTVGNEVQINVKFPQGSIAPLMRTF